MAKEKSLVEEAIIQMKNLEEAVAENAKGILASTMKEEIKELVKESLTEQEEDEIETDVDMEEPDMEEPDMGDDEEGDDESEFEDDEFEDDDESEFEDDEFEDDDMDADNEDEDMMGDMDTIDLTGQSDEQVLRVFQLMDPEDKIIVKKDSSGNINLKDTESNKEYMIVQEQEEEEDYFEGFELEEDDYVGEEDDIERIIEKVFAEQDDELEEDDFYEMDFGTEEMGGMEEELVYEISFDDEDLDEGYLDEEDFYEMGLEDEPVMESKMKKSMKPKGVGIGNPNKKKVYSSKPNMEGGFKTVKKTANKTMGTGKAKFEYKEGENLDGEFKIKPKKVETKEASRTYGNGSKSGRGLRKGITPNRNLTFENTTKEVEILREKNEEYRKALNIFRNKLNEVAVFNSNLAYATRLFTEHSTSKQEKINILRRFDGVETIKESKNLYKSIKDELSSTSGQPMNESFERVIEKAPSTGSAANLIESKTYENPQFLRMKDLMSKLR